jgi:hypothetical protein
VTTGVSTSPDGSATLMAENLEEVFGIEIEPGALHASRAAVSKLPKSRTPKQSAVGSRSKGPKTASAQTSINKDRQVALGELVKAIGEFRKFTAQPLTLRGSDYANAVQELNKAMTLKALDREQTLV